MSFDQVVIGLRETVSEFLHCRHLCCTVFNTHVQGVGMSELERGELGRQVLLIVDGKLHQPQPICPSFLFIGTEETQVLLHFPVHNFRLTICLRVMHRGKLGQDAELLAEICHDLQGELWTPITNNGARKTMILPDME